MERTLTYNWRWRQRCIHKPRNSPATRGPWTQPIPEAADPFPRGPEPLERIRCRSRGPIPARAGIGLADLKNGYHRNQKQFSSEHCNCVAIICFKYGWRQSKYGVKWANLNKYNWPRFPYTLKDKKWRHSGILCTYLLTKCDKCQ